MAIAPRMRPASSERLGHDVYVVLGSTRNLKVTRPGDMELARFYLQQERSSQS